MKVFRGFNSTFRRGSRISKFVFVPLILAVLVDAFTQHALAKNVLTWDSNIPTKAENGDADAQTSFCWSLCFGVIGPRHDCAQAAGWCRKAAEQNNHDGQCILGRMYEEGKGVTQNYAEAAKWYAQGECARELARLYRDGRGVKQDYAQAEKWYLKLADINSATNLDIAADYAEIARFYAVGNKEIPPNYEKAYYWMSVAAHRSHGEYDEHRDEIEKHLTPDQVSEIQKKIWERIPPSRGMLILFRRDMTSAQRGDGLAMLDLGRAYTWGDDVQRDYSQAYFWYSLAAISHKDSKDPLLKRAQALANSLAAKLTPDQLASEQKRLKDWKPTTATDQR